VLYINFTRQCADTELGRAENRSLQRSTRNCPLRYHHCHSHFPSPVVHEQSAWDEHDRRAEHGIEPVSFLGLRNPIHHSRHSGGFLGSRRVGPHSRGILDIVGKTSGKKIEATRGIIKDCSGPEKI
jgi:hypothetical protein